MTVTVRPARENHQPLSPVEILSKDRLVAACVEVHTFSMPNEP
jgi:hypothetical protein